MNKLILTLAGRIEGLHACLEAAHQLATSVGSSRFEVLNIRIDPRSTITSEEIMTTQRRKQIEDKNAAHAARALAVVEEWTERHALPPDRVIWTDVVGTFDETVVERARRADFVVLGHTPGRDKYTDKRALISALLRSDRPVLIVPEEFRSPIGRRVAVAWHDDPRAVKAVLGSVAIFAAASRVWILIASHKDEVPLGALPEIFARREIVAELRQVKACGTSIGEAILAEAAALEVDLLVMGAYDHSPFYESILGGVTKDVLRSGHTPVLMRH